MLNSGGPEHRLESGWYLTGIRVGSGGILQILRAVNRDGSRPRLEPEWCSQGHGDRHYQPPASFKEGEPGKRTGARSKRDGAERLGEHVVRLPPGEYSRYGCRACLLSSAYLKGYWNRAPGSPPFAAVAQR